MPASRGRSSDDDDDRPRRRQDDDEDDDRPRSRRQSDDDDEDDRPRRRRRYDDDDGPSPPRRARRKSRGLSTGALVGIVGGALAGIVLLVVVVLFATGRLSPGRGDISHEKYAAIGPNDTIGDLTKRFGRPKKYSAAQASQVFLGPHGRKGDIEIQSASLADSHHLAREVTAWYGWWNGKEEVYVAEGTSHDGRSGLVIKAYCGPWPAGGRVRPPIADNLGLPWTEAEPIGGKTVAKPGG